MADSELEALRDEVRRRHRAATKKISKLRGKGVDIGGTKLDPRRSIKTIGHYNKKQMRAYLEVINRFQSRRVGFEAGAEGSVFTKSAWQYYKGLEKRYNNKSVGHLNKIGDTFVPISGMTIRQRDATVRPDFVSAQGAVNNRPYNEINLKASNIKGPEALAKLTKSLEKKLARDFLPKELNKSRKEARHMLKIIGDNRSLKILGQLTDNQFDILWNYSGFAMDTSRLYSVYQMKAAGGKDRWVSGVVEDQSNDIREAIQWATTLPTTATKAAKK